MKDRALVLAYAGCSTCKKALAWLDGKKIPYDVRPIVDLPPTQKELAAWLPASGKSVRKWLNTSGLSYRALGKAKVDAASDSELVRWLATDGKLVKRPVLVKGTTILVGFSAEAWGDALLEGGRTA
jgi:arsenate reductase (glutaredoxin)